MCIFFCRMHGNVQSLVFRVWKKKRTCFLCRHIESFIHFDWSRKKSKLIQISVALWAYGNRIDFGTTCRESKCSVDNRSIYWRKNCNFFISGNANVLSFSYTVIVWPDNNISMCIFYLVVFSIISLSHRYLNVIYIRFYFQCNESLEFEW